MRLVFTFNCVLVLTHQNDKNRVLPIRFHMAEKAGRSSPAEGQSSFLRAARNSAASTTPRTVYSRNRQPSR
jgi:hypothetical protein